MCTKLTGKEVLNRMIAAGYSFKEDKSNTWFKSSIPFLYVNDKKIVFSDIIITFGKKVDESNKEELKKLYQSGEIVKINGIELYKAWHSKLSECEFESQLYSLDIRTVKRIREEKEKLGCLRREIGEYVECEKFGGETEIIPGFLNSSDFECGLSEDGKSWCVQFEYMEGDSCVIVKLYFKKTIKPTRDLVMKASELYDMETKFQIGTNKIPEFYTCWECGNKAFWLDSAEDIFECARCAEDRYCGC